MQEKKYEEVGTNYRNFLSWRHEAFAGELIVLYGVFSLTVSTYKNLPEFAWVISLVASPVGFLLWVIDKRTRSLYHATIKAGKMLEGDDGGFYSELLANVVVSKGTPIYKGLTHFLALTLLFNESTILFIIASIVLWKIAYP